MVRVVISCGGNGFKIDPPHNNPRTSTGTAHRPHTENGQGFYVLHDAFRSLFGRSARPREVDGVYNVEHGREGNRGACTVGLRGWGAGVRKERRQ